MRELHNESDQPQDINALHEWSSREAGVREFIDRLGKHPKDATAAEIAAVRPLAQEDLIRGSKGPVFVKTHNAVANVEGYSTINFDITRAAIYILRNPLDVVISYANHTGSTIDRMIEYMADDETCTQLTDQWRVYEFMSSWSFHVASWISVPHRPVLILRYEDMLRTPERSFGRVAAFLRFEPDAQQLQRAITNSSFDRLVEQEEEHGFREKPPKAEVFFRSGKSGQWKDILSAQQIQRIIRAHAPLMMRFGYLEERYNLV